MKKKRTLLLLLVVFAFFNCESTSSDSALIQLPEDPKVIGISGSISKFTRATDTSFEESDQVGVFITKQASSASVMLNGKFTYGTDGFTPEKEQNWYTEKETSHVFSYYPYKSSFTEAFATGRLMIEVKADQSTHTNYTASDFMVGTVDKVNPTNEKINIAFKHLLTKVVVNVNNQTKESIEALTISGFNGSTEYNFVSLYLVKDVITVTPIKFNSPNVSFTNSFAAIIPPQQAQPSLDITIDGQIHNIVVDPAVVLLSGKQLNINIDIEGNTPEEFIFTIITQIINWEDDNDLIFNIEE